jgi:Patatin-like phospholipase
MMLAVGSGGQAGRWTRLAQPAEALLGRTPPAWLHPLGSLAVPAKLALTIARSGRSGRRVALLALTVTSLALLTVVLQLDRILMDMRPPGAEGGGMSALDAAGLVERWAAYAGSSGLAADPHEIAQTYLVLDVALIVTYTTLLALTALTLSATLPTDAAAHRMTLAAAFLLTPVLAAVDLLENASQYAAVRSGDAAVLLQFLSAAKWILLLAVALPIALAAVRLVHDHWDTATRGVLRTLAIARFQLVALLAFAVLLLAPVAGPQAADTILRWGVSDPVEVALRAVVLTLLLSFTLFVTARRCARAPESRQRAPIPLWALLLLSAVLLTAGVILLLEEDQGQGLLVIGGLILATAVLGLPLPSEADRQHVAERRGTVLVPALLAIGPLLLLGLGILGATTGQLALYGFASQAEWTRLTAVAVLMVALTVPAFAGAQRLQAHWPGVVGVVVAGAAATYTAAAVYVNPWHAAELAGAVGVVAAFLILLALLGWAVVALERRYAPPPALALASFHRVPILLLLLAGIVGAALLDKTGDHAMRADKAGPAGGRITAVDALARWREANVPDRQDPANPREAVPLVFVAASGGGIRAAYWTARVLRCVLEWSGPPEQCRADASVPPAHRSARPAGPPAERFGQPVFAASGASGGSLGLVTYAARLISGREPSDWVRKRLGDDYLAPTLAWGLFADLPKAIAGLHVGQDRAEVLERTWEQSWSRGTELWRQGPASGGPLDAGLRSSWHDREGLPLLLLNGTSVHDDCRLSASVLDADVEVPGDSRTADCYSQRSFDTPVVATSPRGDWALPATHDLVDYLSCDEGSRDVRLSTAALLSARFPFVSPSGRIEGCDGEDTVHVVDGGYVDNSGASTAVELWRHLEQRVNQLNRSRREPCIVPVFLQINNDYAREDDRSERRRPLEPFVPLQVFGNVRDGNGADARQAAALEFHREGFGPVRRAVTPGHGAVHRYVHIYPRAHPGTKAPLGWALSKPSMTSLDDQVGRAGQPLETIRRWFDPGLRCER